MRIQSREGMLKLLEDTQRTIVWSDAQIRQPKRLPGTMTWVLEHFGVPLLCLLQKRSDLPIVISSLIISRAKSSPDFYRTRIRSLFILVTNSLTDWLTHSCLVNLLDVTLACEDTNSKLVDVVTVADEDRVVNNLLQISKLRFGKNAKLLFRLWAQGLVKILKLKFRQYLQLESGQFFFCWCFGEVLKLNLGRDCEARSGQDFEA